MTDATDDKQKPWRFQPGKSGNPNGRPRGIRNKATLATQQLFDGEAEVIGRKAIELALDGDITAIRLVLERILPPRKESPLVLDISKPTTSEQITHTLAELIEAVALGEVTPGEAQAVANLLDTMRKAIETEELEKRLTRLEERNTR